MPIDVDASEVHPLDLDLPVPSSGEVKTAEVNTIYVSGTNSGIKTGDVVLLVGQKNAADAEEQTLPKVVRAVDAEDALNRTRVEFEGPVVKPLGYGIKLNQVDRDLAAGGQPQRDRVPTRLRGPPSASRRWARSARCRAGGCSRW